MGIRNDVYETIVVRVPKADPCPYVAGWPNDKFGRLIASHREEVMGVLCRQQGYSSAPFCEPDEIEYLGI